MNVSYGEAHGMAAAFIVTGSATWTFQLAAGGFSSLTGPDGEEWIGFAPGSGGGGGAANVFRGIPNLVYPDNLGHPGHERCRSHVEPSDEVVLITTESLDGLWAWEWRVTEIAANLSVFRVPARRRYWFLYEGTPGGRFEPSRSFWGSDSEGVREDAPDLFAKPGAGGPVITPRSFAYFGHRDCARVLLCTHRTAGDEPSFFAYMRATESTGMVVFGFGRDHADGPLPCLAGPHSFTVQLVEGTDYDEIGRFASRAG
jgi:hypothetical protein